MIMRDRRLERFFVLPFSVRCDSESSVAVSATAATEQSKTEEKGGEDNLKMYKNQMSVSKAAFTQGLHRLIRRFKTFSQFFVYKEKLEQVEKDMEIGFPTDVKHIAHIGIGSDGSTTANQISSWGNHLNRASEILSLPSVSLQQFELAMAAQSHT